MIDRSVCQFIGHFVLIHRHCLLKSSFVRNLSKDNWQTRCFSLLEVHLQIEIGFFFPIRSEVQYPTWLQCFMETLQYARVILRADVFHCVHTDDTVKNLSEVHFVQCHRYIFNLWIMFFRQCQHFR